LSLGRGEFAQRIAGSLAPDQPRFRADPEPVAAVESEVGTGGRVITPAAARTAGLALEAAIGSRAGDTHAFAVVQPGRAAAREELGASSGQRQDRPAAHR